MIQAQHPLLRMCPSIHLGPQFLSHLMEGNRTIIFLMEELIGRCAEVKDFLQVLRSLREASQSSGVSLRMVQRCAFVRRSCSPIYMPDSRRADGVLSHAQLQFISVSLDFDCLPSSRIMSFSIYRTRIFLAASKFWIFFLSA